MKKRSAAYVAQAGVIAAVYAALTLVVLQFPAFLGWGLVQFRLSEAVTVVAAVTPAGVAGLALGCAVANAFNLTVTPLAWFDVVLGSFATLCGALWTWRFRDRTALALAGPVLFNAAIVPAYLPLVLAGAGLYKVPFLGLDLEGAWLPMYLFGVAAIGLSEAVVVYGLGWPLLSAMRRAGIGHMLSE